MSNVIRIETEMIRHKITSIAGPRIEKIETIHFTDGTISRVEFWYENGRLVRVV